MKASIGVVFTSFPLHDTAMVSSPTSTRVGSSSSRTSFSPFEHGAGDKNAVLAHTAGGSASQHAPRLDLVRMSHQLCWNCELVRGASAEPQQCVIRLPVFVHEGVIYRGAVATVWASGFVQVASSGSVAAALAIATRLQRLLRAQLCFASPFIDAVRAERARLLDFVYSSSGDSEGEKDNLLFASLGAPSSSFSSSLVKFSEAAPPQVTFLNAVLHPFTSELLRLRRVHRIRRDGDGNERYFAAQRPFRDACERTSVAVEGEGSGSQAGGASSALGNTCVRNIHQTSTSTVASGASGSGGSAFRPMAAPDHFAYFKDPSQPPGSKRCRDDADDSESDEAGNAYNSKMGDVSADEWIVSRALSSFASGSISFNTGSDRVLDWLDGFLDGLGERLRGSAGSAAVAQRSRSGEDNHEVEDALEETAYVDIKRASIAGHLASYFIRRLPRRAGLQLITHWRSLPSSASRSVKPSAVARGWVAMNKEVRGAECVPAMSVLAPKSSTDWMFMDSVAVHGGGGDGEVAVDVASENLVSVSLAAASTEYDSPASALAALPSKLATNSTGTSGVVAVQAGTGVANITDPLDGTTQQIGCIVYPTGRIQVVARSVEALRVVAELILYPLFLCAADISP